MNRFAKERSGAPRPDPIGGETRSVTDPCGSARSPFRRRITPERQVTRRVAFPGGRRTGLSPFSSLARRARCLARGNSVAATGCWSALRCWRGAFSSAPPVSDRGRVRTGRSARGRILPCRAVAAGLLAWGALAILPQSAAAQSASDGELRLSDGSSASDGRLEIFHDGQWGMAPPPTVLHLSRTPTSGKPGARLYARFHALETRSSFETELCLLIYSVKSSWVWVPDGRLRWCELSSCAFVS